MSRTSWLIGLLLLIAVLLVTGCAPKPAPLPAQSPSPAPAPVPMPTPITPGPVPMPTPVSNGSESCAEIEAKVRQLETENQQLKAENLELRSRVAALTTENQRFEAENQQLNNDIAGLTSVLQNVRSVVISSSYTSTLGELSKILNNTSQLSTFITGLPHLPPLPAALSFADINNAVMDARTLRQLLAGLPDLPPPGWPPFLPFPAALLELDSQRQTFIAMTEWMDNLQDLPTFLQSAQNLEQFRRNIEGYLQDVQSTTSIANDILQQLGSIAGR